MNIFKTYGFLFFIFYTLNITGQDNFKNEGERIKYANKLFEAGLNRVTVSLDAIETELFRELSSTNITPQHIISGIESAINAGLPVKVNTVIMRNYNDWYITFFKIFNYFFHFLCLLYS